LFTFCLLFQQIPYKILFAKELCVKNTQNIEKQSSQNRKFIKTKTKRNTPPQKKAEQILLYPAFVFVKKQTKITANRLPFLCLNRWE
jgi:hypothetical protein